MIGSVLLILVEPDQVVEVGVRLEVDEFFYGLESVLLRVFAHHHMLSLIWPSSVIPILDSFPHLLLLLHDELLDFLVTLVSGLRKLVHLTLLVFCQSVGQRSIILCLLRQLLSFPPTLLRGLARLTLLIVLKFLWVAQLLASPSLAKKITWVRQLCLEVELRD